jgi:hypothetical protein
MTREDPGLARAVLVELADRLERQPNRETDLHTVRGWARAFGLTGDWVDILPPPAGAHHCEYAARLRALAEGVGR